MLENNKRPDGTTLLPWARGKPLAWDVTVPDTFAESHISDTVSTPGAAANKAIQHKLEKYAKLLDTHVFYPNAVETAGSWNSMAIELVQEIDRRYHHRHTGRQRDDIPISAPVHSISKEECRPFFNTMVVE